MKLSKKQMTQAVTMYARKYGYYVRTVRSVTSLKLAAMGEWREKFQVTDRCNCSLVSLGV